MRTLPLFAVLLMWGAVNLAAQDVASEFGPARLRLDAESDLARQRELDRARREYYQEEYRRIVIEADLAKRRRDAEAERRALARAAFLRAEHRRMLDEAAAERVAASNQPRPLGAEFRPEDRYERDSGDAQVYRSGTLRPDTQAERRRARAAALQAGQPEITFVRDTAAASQPQATPPEFSPEQRAEAARIERDTLRVRAREALAGRERRARTERARAREQARVEQAEASHTAIFAAQMEESMRREREAREARDRAVQQSQP